MQIARVLGVQVIIGFRTCLAVLYVFFLTNSVKEKVKQIREGIPDIILEKDKVVWLEKCQK